MEGDITHPAQIQAGVSKHEGVPGSTGGLLAAEITLH